MPIVDHSTIIIASYSDLFSEHIDPYLPRIEELPIELLQRLSRTFMLYELDEAQAPVPSLLIPGQLDRSEGAIGPENPVQVHLIQLKVQVVQEKLLEVSLSWH